MCTFAENELLRTYDISLHRLKVKVVGSSDDADELGTMEESSSDSIYEVVAGSEHEDKSSLTFVRNLKRFGTLFDIPTAELCSLAMGARRLLNEENATLRLVR